MMKLGISLLALLTGCGALTSYQSDCATAIVSSWVDGDGDGFGDTAAAEETCGLPEGYAAVDGDCDDADADAFPGSPELCDAVDNNCDGGIDEGLPEGQYFSDDDGDGFGDAGSPVDACGPTPGTVADDTDCDDRDDRNAPDLTEVCDGGDNDCDDLIDDLDDSTDPGSMTDWYRDEDGDTFGDGPPEARCAADGPFTATTDGDCNDADAAINPDATEDCTGGDEDCDGLLGEDDPSIDPAALTGWYLDDDGDGLGAGAVVNACQAPNSHVANDDDCDDSRVAIGGPVDWYSDSDSDGYGNGVLLAPACPPAAPGTIEATGPIDCDDGNAARFPGNPEVCGDGIDQDCSGADQVCLPVGSFLVNDGDSYLNDPPVYSCLEACALIFGGAANDYECSTSGVFVDNQAYVSGFADATYCTSPVAEGYSLEDAADPGYKCGAVGCAYSAYVQDNCSNGATNWCWPN